LADLSRFLDPPRLRTVEEGFEERHATWLELFFDLVFVVAVAELGQSLTGDPTLHGFFAYLGLFVPVIWAWEGFTFYANRFDTDDLTYRVLILLAMFAVAALATNTPEAIDTGGRAFAVSYVFVRLVLLALYARAIRYVPEARPLSVLYFRVFTAGTLIWIVSIAVPPPGRWWLWAFALVLELAAPFVAWGRLPRAAVDPRHLPERFGLFTIIVLGESVLSVVLGVADTTWEVDSGFTAAGGFVIAAALWWIYFDFLDESVVRRGRISGLVFTYAHFPVLIGIATVGVGVKLEILAAGGEERYDDTGWILCAPRPLHGRPRGDPSHDSADAVRRGRHDAARDGDDCARPPRPQLLATAACPGVGGCRLARRAGRGRARPPRIALAGTRPLARPGRARPSAAGRRARC
jgi:low temperature requirement protein LtrA